MRKKVLATILGVTMVCGLVTGCGNKSETKESKKLDSSVKLEDLQKATSDYYKDGSFEAVFKADGSMSFESENGSQENKISIDGKASKSKDSAYIKFDSDVADQKTSQEVYLDITDTKNIIVYSSADGDNWTKEEVPVEEITGDLDYSDMLSSDAKVETKDGNYVVKVDVPVDNLAKYIEKAMTTSQVQDAETESETKEDLVDETNESGVFSNIVEQAKEGLTITETATYNSDKILTGVDINIKAKDVNFILAKVNGELNINIDIEPSEEVIVEIPEEAKESSDGAKDLTEEKESVEKELVEEESSEKESKESKEEESTEKESKDKVEDRKAE